MMDSKRKDDKSRTLQLQKEPGRTREQLLAKVAAQPAMNTATVVTEFSKGNFGELNLTEMVAQLNEKAGAVHRGDLREAEALLVCQAEALNSIFTALARRASLNMGEYLNAAETYMRLALKAQSQCRATLETLAAIKNPPIVYARQANIAQGPQQVNNGISQQVRAGAHARENEIEQSKLSGATDELLQDAGASPITGAVNLPVESLGEIDRAEIRRG